MNIEKYSLLFVLTLLLGCSEKEVEILSIKNMERYEQVDENQIRVYCPVGICRFKVQLSQPISLVVFMYYSKNKPFKKIEGISLNGKYLEQHSEQTLPPNSFELAMPHKSSVIQVVDYYR